LWIFESQTIPKEVFVSSKINKQIYDDLFAKNKNKIIPNTDKNNFLKTKLKNKTVNVVTNTNKN